MTPSPFTRSCPGLLGIVAVLAATACSPTNQTPKTVVDHVAHADDSQPNDASAPSEAAKPESADAEVVAVPIEGSGLVEAKATVVVQAPMDKARATILKFEDYPQFMPEYSDAKRLGKLSSGNEKVYMEITTLGGIAKMFANVEVLPAATAGATETHVARFLDGNVRQFKATWQLTKMDDARTEISLQVFLHPSLPLPDFLVNTANTDGAKKGVLAMKRRIEKAP